MPSSRELRHTRRIEHVGAPKRNDFTVSGWRLPTAFGLGSAGGWWVCERRRRPVWLTPAGVARDGALHVRTLGTGRPVVLLHGLLGSGRFWGGTFDALAQCHQLIVPDLLGFGRSPRPDLSRYDPPAHAAAVATALDEAGADGPATLVAHSLGVIVALAIADEHPDLVQSVIGFGPPLYPDAASARGHVAALGGLARMLAFDTPLAAQVCAWMCNHRRLAAFISQVVRPALPPMVAVDSVEHSWPSYSRSMRHTLLDGQPIGRAWDRSCPVLLVAGTDDPVVDRAYLETLSRRTNVTLLTWQGGHDLPLRQPLRCVELIAAHLDG